MRLSSLLGIALTSATALGLEPHSSEKLTTQQYVLYSLLCAGLISFGGLIAGLTLGLMSLDPLTVKLLRKGTKQEKRCIKKIEPLLRNYHFLLVTLVFWEALATEALPIVLEKMVNEYMAIAISVTVVLFFGEILPEAIISRYTLAFGARIAWLVKILMVLSFPIAYPISLFLDFILGKNHTTFFRRAQLQELMRLHATDTASILTEEEITVIRGAMTMQEAACDKAYTPLAKLFMVGLHDLIDDKLLRRIRNEAYSRIPVFKDRPSNILGIVLAKDFIGLRPEENKRIYDMKIIPIPLFSDATTLWDVMNRFKTCGCLMGAIIHHTHYSPPNDEGDTEQQQSNSNTITGEMTPTITYQSAGLVANVPIESTPTIEEAPAATEPKQSETTPTEEKKDVVQENLYTPTYLPCIGIITMENVMQELLQEEINDESDVHAAQATAANANVDLHHHAIAAKMIRNLAKMSKMRYGKRQQSVVNEKTALLARHSKSRSVVPEAMV